MKLVICGDVHGADFWKIGAEYVKNNSDAKMICLGDYLDPYTRYEGINHEQALVNFKDLLDFAQEYKDRVILLKGNHDYFYFDQKYECCRHDYRNYEAASRLFKENKDLFKLAHLEDGYLFTHAGICNGWVLYNDLENLTIEEIVEYINTDPRSLWQVGYSRGGRKPCGSPIWCCWEGDWETGENPYDIVQCFSHTRQFKSSFPKFNLEKQIYMFDVLNCFLLENGEITLLS